MKNTSHVLSLGCAAAIAAACWLPASVGRAEVPMIRADPYIGAIAVDAATGKTLFQDNADVPGYPASCIKLINLVIILDRIQSGSLRLTDKVTITAEVARIGGSQAYLKEGEVFSVEDLLYAMIVQSGNDAAVALAARVAGSPTAFVRLMNQKAVELGMRDTVFTSVHGLPPDRAATQPPDVSTPRDLAILGREIVNKYPEATRYTSTIRRPFRKQPRPFILDNHNRLLGVVDGVDGLKTGWIRAGGYSIVVSAKRNGRRVIVVVLGSHNRDVRNAKACELVNAAFAAAPPRPAGPRIVAVATNEASEKALFEERAARPHWGLGKKTLAIGGAILAVLVVIHIVRSSRRNRNLE
ncbi:MAG: D-alanyl-D-alanine carboxypeptidase family protein [Verrucomicrobiota bacterium]|nr:D-alanyl-D-alanine carboxypeptidase family protein [Verrucomicrobiota bacterium]